MSHKKNSNGNKTMLVDLTGVQISQQRENKMDRDDVLKNRDEDEGHRSHSRRRKRKSLVVSAQR